MTGKPLPAEVVNAALRSLLSAQGGPQVRACRDSSRRTRGAESADRNIVENGRKSSKIPIGFVGAVKKINEFL